MLDENQSDIETIDASGDIQFDNVSFSYPARTEAQVLRNLHLIARRGETTALVGPSGCGMTFIKIKAL